jgi:NADPH:quinone reductase-like Zn-dependent oxidoreductase
MGRLFIFGISSFVPGKRRSIIAALRGVLAMPRFSSLGLMKDNRGVFGINLGTMWGEAEQFRRMLEQIVGHVATGELSPVVDRTFAFDHAALAHGYVQDRKNFGKVVLTPR